VAYFLGHPVYYGGGDHQTLTRAAYGCLVAGRSPWAHAWNAAYRLYARYVCDTKAQLQLQYAADGAV